MCPTPPGSNCSDFPSHRGSPLIQAALVVSPAPTEMSSRLPRPPPATSYFSIHLGIQEIGEMMGLNSEELERALCSRTVETGKEKVVTMLNVTQVRALLKEQTLRLFRDCHSNETVSPPPHPLPCLPGSICSGCPGKEYLQPPLRLDRESHQREHPGEVALSQPKAGLASTLWLPTHSCFPRCTVGQS